MKIIPGYMGISLRGFNAIMPHPFLYVTASQSPAPGCQSVLAQHIHYLQVVGKFNTNYVLFFMNPYFEHYFGTVVQVFGFCLLKININSIEL